MQAVQSVVDVGITLQQMEMSLLYDRILIAGDDGGFTEAIEKVKRKNKIMFLVEFQNTINLRLQLFVKHVFYFDVNNNKSKKEECDRNNDHVMFSFENNNMEHNDFYNYEGTCEDETQFQQNVLMLNEKD